MNRLESIKERQRIGITEYMHHAEKAEIYREDSAYLLQRLGIAQKALERMVEGNDIWMGDFDDSPVDAYKELAKHTLDQLKE